MRIYLTASVLLISLVIAFLMNLIPKQNPQQEQDMGIGPVKKVVLGPLNKKLIQQGQSIFNNKCTQCHDLDQKRVGPTLRDVTKRRTPEFIMNYLLNTVQMQKEDQIVKDLLEVYLVPMTPQGLTQDQARTVLEYLRSVAN